MRLVMFFLCLFAASSLMAIDDGVIDGNGDTLIGGIDYKGHNVGLINKHGWEFSNQRSFSNYLKNYYTEVANILVSRANGHSAWIPGGTTDVFDYKDDKVEVVEPGDHIIDAFGHLRPAIVRYWSGP